MYPKDKEIEKILQSERITNENQFAAMTGVSISSYKKLRYNVKASGTSITTVLMVCVCFNRNYESAVRLFYENNYDLSYPNHDVKVVLQILDMLPLNGNCRERYDKVNGILKINNLPLIKPDKNWYPIN